MALAQQTFESLKTAVLAEIDPEIADLLGREADRQRGQIELIASENFTWPSVLEAVGSVPTNKYAEGLPGKRYYGGCEVVDEIEDLARERAKSLFGAEHANVQAHAGAQANMAVYFAVLAPGDRVLGLSLDHGGHLTHGLKVNFSGKLYEFHHYGVSRETMTVDYDDVLARAREVQPKLIVCGGSAYPRTVEADKFREIADEVGALLMCDMAHFSGLVAAGIHPSPVPHCDFVTSTTHKTLAGPRAGFVLCKEEHATKLDRANFPGMQGGPLLHTIAAKAACFRIAQTDAFKDYQRQVRANADALARGLVDGGFDLVSGGTDTHLVLLDLRASDWTGLAAEERLHEVALTVNRNTVPFDERPPMVSSGVRIGTPAATMRGFDETDFEEVASIIVGALQPDADVTPPLVQHKLSYLRDTETPTVHFRKLVEEVTLLLTYEATKDLPTEDVQITTPLETAPVPRISGKKVAVCPILRAGLGMLDGVLTLISGARVGFIGLYRDEATLHPVEYYVKLPQDVADRDVILLDPMLATGNSTAHAVRLVKDAGASSVRLIAIIAAPEGVQNIQETHPDVQIVVAAIDRGLNEKGFIVPGLGDAGDRLYGTK